MPETDELERYDFEELRSDLARIRAKLRRLDTERRSTVDMLEAAMIEAERLLAERLGPARVVGL